MIERMASDRLWIYTGIVGSLFGAAFLFWFKDTKMAMWAVAKFDNWMEEKKEEEEKNDLLTCGPCR